MFNTDHKFFRSLQEEEEKNRYFVLVRGTFLSNYHIKYALQLISVLLHSPGGVA
jgi:hypothetical protein